MMLEEIEFDPELNQPNRTYTPPAVLPDDPVTDFFEKADIDTACRQTGTSSLGRTSEQVKHLEMLKGCLGDAVPAQQPESEVTVQGNLRIIKSAGVTRYEVINK